MCESRTLTKVFGNSHNAANPVLVSSIKGNIGHCEAASGAAGLAKLLLMLQKEAVPVQAGLTKVNPRLHGFHDGRLVIPRETTPWKKRNGIARRALLNNFGAAGSNAMLILEEPPALTESRDSDLQRSAYPFNLSAKSSEALQESILLYQQFFEDYLSTLRLDDICYTATARRAVYSHRISLSSSSMQDLIDQLRQVNVPELASQTQNRGLIFAFSGQGAVYRGMGHELLKTSPIFRDIVQQCNATLVQMGVPSIIRFLDSDNGREHSLGGNEEVVVAQCACVVLEYALARLVMSWGIVPQYVVGHR